MEEKRKDNGKREGREEGGEYARDEIDPGKLARVIWGRKKFIALVTAGVTILTLVVCFIMTPVYRSSAVILPINKTMPTILEGGGNLSSLIGLLGFGGGGSSSKILAILESNSIKERILTKHDLMKVIFEDEWDEKRGKWKQDPPDIWEGIRAMEKIVEIETDRKTGVILISTDFKDPVIAANISRWFVEELSQILNEKSFSMARHYRENIEQILSSLGGHLKLPEGELPEFTAFMQRMRDIKISEKAYEELLVQYYIAKFQEAKEDVIFQEIDESKPPDKPERPKKLLYTLIAFIVSLFLSVFYVAVSAKKNREEHDNVIDGG
jgi:uncharacterized protein involved in exopolysaccharide biosynthesis